MRGGPDTAGTTYRADLARESSWPRQMPTGYAGPLRAAAPERLSASLSAERPSARGDAVVPVPGEMEGQRCRGAADADRPPGASPSPTRRSPSARWPAACSGCCGRASGTRNEWTRARWISSPKPRLRLLGVPGFEAARLIASCLPLSGQSAGDLDLVDDGHDGSPPAASAAGTAADWPAPTGHAPDASAPRSGPPPAAAVPASSPGTPSVPLPSQARTSSAGGAAPSAAVTGDGGDAFLRPAVTPGHPAQKRT